MLRENLKRGGMKNININVLFKYYYYCTMVHLLSYLYLFLSICNHMFSDISTLYYHKRFFLLVYNLLIKELPNSDSASGRDGVTEYKHWMAIILQRLEINDIISKNYFIALWKFLGCGTGRKIHTGTAWFLEARRWTMETGRPNVTRVLREKVPDRREV